MERRKFLFTSGVPVLTLTGGYTFTANSSPTASPTETVEEYYRRAGEVDTQEQFAAEIQSLAHSVSPLSEVAESLPSTLYEASRQDLVETEVVARDIDAERIQEISSFFAGTVSDEEIAALADTNAVVATTLEDDEVIGGELAKEWLLAPEDGNWRLVWFDDRNSPRAAVRRFFGQVSLTEYAGQLDDPVDTLTHPSSPLVNVAEYTPWYFSGIQRRELLGTEVVTENIAVSDIASEFDPITNFGSESSVEDIAEENAVVAVSLRDDQLDIEEFEQEWLTTPVNGEWRVAWF